VSGDAGPGNSFADLVTPQAGYEQFTFAATYLHDLTDTLSVEFWASYDTFDYERFTAPGAIQANREDEFYTRALTRWTPNDRHSAAFGVAYYREWFGLPSPGFPGGPATVGGLPPSLTFPWETDSFSLLGEYVWNINDCWTAFAGLRTDDHTYTKWLISPRAALVATPNEVDTYKFIWSIANRRATDADLRRQFLQTGTFGRPEENESFEARYERQSCEHVKLAASWFYQFYSAIGFNPTILSQSVLGDFQMGGLELEASYREEHTRWLLSHSYTQLVNGFLPDPTTIQGITAEPYGFGRDLSSWSPHITKLYVDRDLNCLWNVSGSLRVYWGFPGDQDLTSFNNSLPTPSGFLGLSDPGYRKAFRGSYFLNFGLQRKIGCDQGAIRLDLFNVLGWIDQDLNKRNVLRRAYYRAEAPSVALSARWQF
jgi:hypothetical protein